MPKLSVKNRQKYVWNQLYF